MTVAEFLKTQGYDTAAFGKWHLGGFFYDRSGTPYTARYNPITDPAAVDWEHRLDGHAVDNGFDIFRGLAVTINLTPYVWVKEDRIQFYDPNLGTYRDALNTDPFHSFTLDELHAGLTVGATGSAGLADLPSDVAPDGESFLNVLHGRNKPVQRRDSIVVSSQYGHLAVISTDGWKLIDITGGGGLDTSFDAANNDIDNAAGVNQGTPKQLFHLPSDLGEHANEIADLTDDATISRRRPAATGSAGSINIGRSSRATSSRRFRTTTSTVCRTRSRTSIPGSTATIRRTPRSTSITTASPISKSSKTEPTRGTATPTGTASPTATKSTSITPTRRSRDERRVFPAERHATVQCVQSLLFSEYQRAWARK